MRTISSVVETYIKGKPFLVSFLNQGIINLTALAREIIPEIEREVGKKVNEGAVIMALKRISEELEFKATQKLMRVIHDISHVTIRSDLNDYAYRSSDSLLECISLLIQKIQQKEDAFFASSRGVNETNIVVNTKMDGLVLKLFEHEELLLVHRNLSSLTIRLPKDNVSVPGVYYLIFQQLSWEGINIYEVISTALEFTILVDDTEVDKAFKVLKNLRKS